MTSLILVAMMATNVGFTITNQWHVDSMWSNAYAISDSQLYSKPSEKTIFNFTSAEYMTFQNFTNQGSAWNPVLDLKSGELHKASTNLIFHTKLKPLVTHSNGYYWIRFEQPKK